MADLTTLANVKEFLDISGSGDDALLENLIDRATGEIQAYLGRPITSTTATTERVTVPPGSHICQVRHYPIISITTILEGGGDGDTLVADTDFECKEQDKELGQIIRINAANGDPVPWTSVERGVVVTYVHGFSAVPEEIEGFVLALVAHDWLQSPASSEKRFGLSSRSPQSGGSHAYRSRDEVWTDYRHILDAHRKVA